MKNFKILFAFTLLIITFLSAFPSIACAETKEMIAEGTYNMGDGETPLAAEERALLAAKRTALEEAGTYVESYSKMNHFQLTHDEIQVLSSGIMAVTILEKKRTLESNGTICFWTKISATVSTDNIADMASHIKDKSIAEEYKTLQDNLKTSQQVVEDLKKELREAKSSHEKDQIKVEINNKEVLFQANIWLDKGHKLAIAKLYGQAISAYNQALISYPRYSQAYSGRGRAFAALKQYEQAITDFNRAIALNPNNPWTYLTKAIVLEKLNRTYEAIAAYRQFIAYAPPQNKQYIQQVEHRIHLLEYDR